MNIEIANKLQQMRKKNGLSQEELAAKMGIDCREVSKWERAEAAPDMDNLILLSKLYGVTIDEMLSIGTSSETVSAGFSLRKDDYGYTDDPIREKRPDNYTEEEIFPNTNMNVENSIPQGAPFGADIDEDEKKAADANREQDDFAKNIERAGRAIGDVINAAGQKLNDTIKNADGQTENWEVKFEREMEKFGEKMEEFGEEMERKFGNKNDNCFTDDIAPKMHGKRHATLLDKLFPVLMVIVFFLSIPLGLAHLGWLAFLFIPLYYTTKEAIRKRNPLIFCYPVFCVVVYVGVGLVISDLWFLGNLWWSTMWMIFLTIPVYYIVFSHFYGKKK